MQHRAIRSDYKFIVWRCGRSTDVASISRIDSSGTTALRRGADVGRVQDVAGDRLLLIGSASIEVNASSIANAAPLPYRLVIKTLCNACAIRVQRSSHSYRAKFILNGAGNSE